jgi:hypothetical protein
MALLLPTLASLPTCGTNQLQGHLEGICSIVQVQHDIEAKEIQVPYGTKTVLGGGARQGIVSGGGGHRAKRRTLMGGGNCKKAGGGRMGG